MISAILGRSIMVSFKSAVSKSIQSRFYFGISTFTLKSKSNKRTKSVIFGVIHELLESFCKLLLYIFHFSLILKVKFFLL